MAKSLDEAGPDTQELVASEVTKGVHAERRAASMRRTGSEVGGGLALANLVAAFLPDTFSVGQVAAVSSAITAFVPFAGSIIRSIAERHGVTRGILTG